MNFKSYATVYGEAVIVDRQVDTEAQSPENCLAYQKILEDKTCVREDPTIPEHEIVFNIRKQNDSAASILVAVEHAVAIGAIFVSGKDADADKNMADDFIDKAFQGDAEPQHEAVNIESPGCYMVVRKIGDEVLSDEDLLALVFNVENLAAAFFRSLGMCA